MSISSNKTARDEAKGFAGLSSMVSDVDEILAVIKQSAIATPNRASPPIVNANATQSTPQPSLQGYEGTPKSNIKGVTPELIVFFAVIAGFIWFIFFSNNKTPEYSSTNSAPASLTPEKTVATTLPSASSSEQIPLRPIETLPQVGNGLVLSIAEIRYCLAQNIRLVAVKSTLNPNSNTEVDMYNFLVSDFNSRCSNYRYNRGDLEIAQYEVEQFRRYYEAIGTIHSDAFIAVSPRVPLQSVTPSASQENSASAATDINSQSSQNEQESNESPCFNEKNSNDTEAYISCLARQNK